MNPTNLATLAEQLQSIQNNLESLEKCLLVLGMAICFITCAGIGVLVRLLHEYSRNNT